MNEPLGTGYKSLRKGRHSQENGTYLLTSVTHHRIPWFEAFDLACTLSACIEAPQSLADAKVLAWVVMPDHIHLLLQLGGVPLAREAARLKSRSARLLNRQIGRSGRFWCAGYHDHALRREEDLRDVARYIVANPLRAGLAERCGLYPFWNAVWV